MEYAVPSFLITATICHDFDVRPGSKKEPMLLWDVHPMEGLGVAEPNPRGNEVDHTPDVGPPGTDVEVGGNPDEPSVCGKPGSQEMAVDQLSWDPPQIDEMIAGCEHGGVSNPGVEIPVENVVEEVLTSQNQKRTADTVQPPRKPRSKKRRNNEKEVESCSTKRTAASNKADSKPKGGLYGCLSVPDA